MAYLREMKQLCHSCTKEAVVELRTYRNETYGLYCREHGKRLLEMVKKDEARGLDTMTTPRGGTG